MCKLNFDNTQSDARNEKHMRERQNVKNMMGLQGETRLIFQLLKCSNFIEREMNTILRHSGLKQQQFAVLNEIIMNGPLSQKELVDNLLFGKSNTSRIVKILSEKRLIQITSAPLDRRLTLLVETPEGDTLWRDCIQRLNKSSAEFLPLMSGGDVGSTFKTLKKLEKSLSVKRNGS